MSDLQDDSKFQDGVGELVGGFETDSGLPLKGYSILDACTGCGTCMSICPTGAIFGGPGKVHCIDYDLCILCGSCARVCPNSCIEDSSGTIAQRLGKRFWNIPHFNESKCKGCGMCVSMCPAGVLVHSNGMSSVPRVSNSKLCASCRICSKVCVFDAVEFFPASNGSGILFDVNQVGPGEGE